LEPGTHGAPADDYLHWVRSVAEARWANAGVSELPWWIQAKHVDEIADADRHPDATTAIPSPNGLTKVSAEKEPIPSSRDDSTISMPRFHPGA